MLKLKLLLSIMFIALLFFPETQGLLTKVIVANGQGVFQRRGGVIGNMYFCGRDSSNWPNTYKDTWFSDNVRDCLYGDDGSSDGRIPAAIDIVYPFFLDEIGFLYGVNAKMTVTGEAALTSFHTIGDSLHLYIFNFSSAAWEELGAISQSPAADPCANTALGTYTDSTITVTKTQNLFNYADGNGNMKLRWFVQSLATPLNPCLFARIDFMQILFEADAIPLSPSPVA